MPEHTPNFLIEEQCKKRADEMSWTKETTLELIKTDAGVEHAHRSRPLGEVAMVGVVQRRPHEVAHLRHPPCHSQPPWQPLQGDLRVTGNKKARRLPEWACRRRASPTRTAPRVPTARTALHVGARGCAPRTPAP